MHVREYGHGMCERPCLVGHKSQVEDMLCVGVFVRMR